MAEPLQQFERRDADLWEKGINVTGDEKPDSHLYLLELTPRSVASGWCSFLASDDAVAEERAEQHEGRRIVHASRRGQARLARQPLDIDCSSSILGPQ